jgi:hypothetical protein
MMYVLVVVTPIDPRAVPNSKRLKREEDKFHFCFCEIDSLAETKIHLIDGAMNQSIKCERVMRHGLEGSHYCFAGSLCRVRLEVHMQDCKMSLRIGEKQLSGGGQFTESKGVLRKASPSTGSTGPDSGRSSPTEPDNSRGIIQKRSFATRRDALNLIQSLYLEICDSSQCRFFASFTYKTSVGHSTKPMRKFEFCFLFVRINLVHHKSFESVRAFLLNGKPTGTQLCYFQLQPGACK